MKPITALYQGALTDAVIRSLSDLGETGLLGEIVAMVPPDEAAAPESLGGVTCRTLRTEQPGSAEMAAGLLAFANEAPYILRVEPAGGLSVVPRALDRMLNVARSTGAVLTYGDYQDADGDRVTPHPLADYQEGSLGDRFQFGPLQLWNAEALALARGRYGEPPGDLQWHAWYDLRLKGACVAPVVRLPEPLAVRQPEDTRRSGAAVFDYLLTQRDVQQEAERVCGHHLLRTGALLGGPFKEFESLATWPVVASVVIPVRDRVLTVADAVRSALDQEAEFPFNVLVVDNHSTDGTAEILDDLAAQDSRLVHIVPGRRDLGIGGCWNEAIFHAACGCYAVQLDSDDLYNGVDVLERVVAELQGGRCGMVIGSYTTVDLSLSEIAPGLIDHREWTNDNGPNNALRIDGLGAPRCFATELVRRHPFPNVSYGEDYAVALRICREFKVGRIYDSLYSCRRWEDNTDADLSPSVVAGHQTYKDRIRTLELAARRRLNAPAEGGA